MNSKADTPLCSVGYRVVEPCGRLPFRSDARGDILIPKYLLFASRYNHATETRVGVEAQGVKSSN